MLSSSSTNLSRGTRAPTCAVSGMSKSAVSGMSTCGIVANLVAAVARIMLPSKAGCERGELAYLESLWSVSMASSPWKSALEASAFVAPEPTPPNVMPLISLFAPAIAPPCHTRTYRMTPEPSVDTVPPYVGPVMRSICCVVGADVGALPSTMMPPHLPRFSRTAVEYCESDETVSLDAFSGLRAVKVMGDAAVPSAMILPPFKTTRAGAAPPMALGVE